MVLKTNRITVTLRGKALDNGKFGDSVRVMNTDSKKVSNSPGPPAKKE